MRAVVTRVSQASVSIEGKSVADIGQGLLVLLGIAPHDSCKEAAWLAAKICHLRMFSDADGRMNMDLAAAKGALLVVSQFTLYADLHGRRPGFSPAASSETAQPLYEFFLEACHRQGFLAEHGEFGADMQVASLNDGPVTFLFDTADYKIT